MRIRQKNLISRLRNWDLEVSKRDFNYLKIIDEFMVDDGAIEVSQVQQPGSVAEMVTGERENNPTAELRKRAEEDLSKQPEKQIEKAVEERIANGTDAREILNMVAQGMDVQLVRAEDFVGFNLVLSKPKNLEK